MCEQNTRNIRSPLFRYNSLVKIAKWPLHMGRNTLEKIKKKWYKNVNLLGLSLFEILLLYLNLLHLIIYSRNNNKYIISVYYYIILNIINSAIMILLGCI